MAAAILANKAQLARLIVPKSTFAANSPDIAVKTWRVGTTSDHAYTLLTTHPSLIPNDQPI